MIEDIKYIAKEAGIIIREGFGKQLDIEFKTGEGNLVTHIDKKSEKCITDFIKKKYPTHGIIAEEGTDISSSSDYMWVIDPLDGTTNFAHGLPIFSVSIGLLKNKEIVAGVIYDVMKDELYSSEKNSGAYVNDTKIKVSSNDKISRSFLVTGFPYNIKENPMNAFEKFVNITREARAVRRLGSAAIDLCYVAKGVFDGFWEINLNPWDIAAGILLIEEAQGECCDFNGNGIDIYSKQILACNPFIKSSLLDFLNN